MKFSNYIGFFYKKNEKWIFTSHLIFLFFYYYLLYVLVTEVYILIAPETVIPILEAEKDTSTLTVESTSNPSSLKWYVSTTPFPESFVFSFVATSYSAK